MASSPLLFIDTNVLLDFYRMREDSGIKLLRRIDSLHDQIITTYQVEMEFKRNRQRVILEFFGELKNCVRRISAPAFLAESQTNKALSTLLARTEVQVTKLRARLLDLIENPAKDPVLTAAESLFANQHPTNLRRDNTAKVEIKSRAAMRFGLGYPPRKQNDTSMGDAFNWEWILACIKEHNRDVVIVSRDADYGVTIQDNSYPNDFLVQEVQERTKRTRRIRLVDRLSKALKHLKIDVSPEEIKQENAVSASQVIAALSGATANPKPTSPFPAALGDLDILMSLSEPQEKSLSELLAQYLSPVSTPQKQAPPPPTTEQK